MTGNNAKFFKNTSCVWGGASLKRTASSAKAGYLYDCNNCCTITRWNYIRFGKYKDAKDVDHDDVPAELPYEVIGFIP